jgi:1,4-alpha-glucan branching enzyme
VQKLNELYRNEPALYEKQFDSGGFEWVDLNHRSESVIVYKRRGKRLKDDVLVILNMTPVVRHDWEVHVHGKSEWKEIFNSDSKEFWGTGDVFNPDIKTEHVYESNNWYKLKVHLPALAGIVLK